MAAMVVYAHAFFVRERVTDLATSLLAISDHQFHSGGCVSVMTSPPDTERQVLPGSILVVLGSLNLLLLDCCDSSKRETVMLLSLLGLNLFSGLVRALFIFEDSPALTGFGERRHGSFTKLEIMRSAFVSMLVLTFNSFKDDSRHAV